MPRTSKNPKKSSSPRTKARKGAAKSSGAKAKTKKGAKKSSGAKSAVAKKGGGRGKNPGGNKKKVDNPAPQHTIAERAYSMWREQGSPHGRDVEHWLQAENELAGGQN